MSKPWFDPLPDGREWWEQFRDGEAFTQPWTMTGAQVWNLPQHKWEQLSDTWRHAMLYGDLRSSE